MLTLADMSLHPSAAAGFARAAHSYERGRPGYPTEAIQWLCERLQLGPGRTVLDLGAGTGKLTRELVPTGAFVLALEPVVEMAEVLRAVAPTVEVVTATASATGLPSQSVDAGTAGQAFHWFSDEQSLMEIHRVLRPEAPLGLIWNHRDLSTELWAAIDVLMEAHRRGEPTYKTGEWRPALTASGLFREPEGRVFPLRQVLTPEQLVDRVTSVSYVAILEAGERERIADRVLDLGRAAAAGAGGRLELRYRTEVWITHGVA
jgi:SAM-dependent methyltransferase